MVSADSRGVRVLRCQESVANRTAQHNCITYCRSIYLGRQHLDPDGPWTGNGNASTTMIAWSSDWRQADWSIAARSHAMSWDCSALWRCTAVARLFVISISLIY